MLDGDTETAGKELSGRREQGNPSENQMSFTLVQRNALSKHVLEAQEAQTPRSCAPRRRSRCGLRRGPDLVPG